MPKFFFSQNRMKYIPFDASWSADHFLLIYSYTYLVPDLRKTPKTIIQILTFLSLWFFAFFSTQGPDRHRNILIKNDQLVKTRLLRGHSSGLKKIQVFNPLPQLFLKFPKSNFFLKGLVESQAT